MKKQIVLIAIVFAAFFSNAASAQVSVRINLGVQPIWGPVGYEQADYYYIPDADAYYDVNARKYIYLENGGWVIRGELPQQYRGIDMYNVHKVVINEREPWRRNDYYRAQFGAYRGKHDQHPIRDSRDQRYYENPQHPQHAQWHGNPGRGHDDHGDKGRGNEDHGDRGRGHEDHGDKGQGKEDHGHDGHGHGGEGHR